MFCFHSLLQQLYIFLTITGDNQTQRQRDSANDITRMLITVVIISLICNLSEPIRRLLEYFNGGYSKCEESFDMYVFEQVASLFPTINASVNFYIYYWTGKEFRATLEQMCKCGRAPRGGEHEMTAATMQSSF